MTKHMDEARSGAIASLRATLEEHRSIERAVLIDDVFGVVKVVFWASHDDLDKLSKLISDRMSEAASPFWSNEIWAASGASETDRLVYDRAWNDGYAIGPRLRLADRVRNRTAWFRPIGTPPWNAVGDESGPPIIVFYSFKGGVGRTTALASFAIQRARTGERIAVIDLDLDGPGVGTLLAADDRGTTANWGVVDYLLERPLAELELRDYYHACRRAAVTGGGEILVIPAGDLAPNRDYLGKLARVDLDPPTLETGGLPLEPLLNQVNRELQPQWVLVDARAGLSEPAGLMLSGIAHLSILFGTSSEQSWRGLQPVLERIGASRVREKKPQLECILVHAMVPQDVETAAIAMKTFADRALSEFRDYYYAPDPQDPEEDFLWYVRDSEDSDAPHAPVPISYQPQLAHFSRIDDVANQLCDVKMYQEFADRITQRFRHEED